METCWQYLIKTSIGEKKIEPCPANLDKYEFSKIDYTEAKNFIEKYEWLRNMGTSKFAFALKFENLIASVICFGPCVAPQKLRKIFSENNSGKIIQLTRGATSFWAPKWSASKLISLSLAYIKSSTPYRIIIAYADIEAGEIGTVYQASNAFYIGMTNPGGGKKYIINGKMYDPRKVVAKFGSRAKNFIKLIDPNFTTVPINPKHRYIFLIGERKEKAEYFKLIKDKIQPYPKRPTNVDSLLEDSLVFKSSQAMGIDVQV